MLCIDEADLIFSFGYEDDMKLITQNLPQRSYQCILTSATLTDNVLTLKQLVMHNAKTVEIDEVKIALVIPFKCFDALLFLRLSEQKNPWKKKEEKLCLQNTIISERIFPFFEKFEK